MDESKVAVVLGASKGIGAAVVSALLDIGVNVVAVSRNQVRLEELVAKQVNKKGSWI